MRWTLVLLGSLLILDSCKNEGTKHVDTTTKSGEEEQKGNTAENVRLPGKHAAEDSIVYYLSEVELIRSGDDYEKLNNVNKMLMEYMRKICSDETLLQHELKAVNSAGMTVLTSDDNKFRIYCWDTETGGTMHFYDAILQYKTQSGSEAYILNDISVSSEDGGADCGYWYTELHTIHANAGKTYYLPIYYGRYSGIEHASGIAAFAIEGNKLNNEPRIFKPTGKPLYDISYSFTSGTADKESVENYITLSADKKTLSIPVTDKDRVVTDRSLIYKFDGDKFVYDKNAH